MNVVVVQLVERLSTINEIRGFNPVIGIDNNINFWLSGKDETKKME